MKNIRNFCILAHIDHGKSTLADRFLELTNTVEKRKMKEQYLDRMVLEREKGITIKMQPVRMEYKEYILNLIDTPGHVDFSYEVSRSLAAVEGAILLVDATQGIQAQTLTNLEFAKKQGLVIIPVINKIDVLAANVEKTKLEIKKLLKVDDILLISAKTGKGTEEVLEKIIEKVPSPISNSNDLQALIFDSEYDSFKGIIAYVRIFNGFVKKGEKINLVQSKAKSEVIELGYFKPEFFPSKDLKQGEIGYIATGLKNIEDCRVGDTIGLKALVGYKEPQPTIFASFYPIDKHDHDTLKQALEKLKLNDASLSFSPESSNTLGRGFYCGFLGMLHLEIVSERLKRDFDLELVITSPNVVYIDNKEPWMELEIITPQQYFGEINKLLSNFSGEFKDTNWITEDKILIKYEGPLDIVIQGFYDKLKTVSSGYASMSYTVLGYREANLVRLDILINKEPVEAFSKVVRKDNAYYEGKRLVKLLKDNLPAYQWAVPIQACVDGRVVARETKSAMRKDVTGALYGGDVTRKKKLLEKQKKGKKKLAQFGKISIPSDVFLKVLKGK
ncbi:GTP-binding protein [Patescibacteria group bacterium]|nr:GTP-binding protein [Patescibacteria group bacterium]